MSYEFETTQQRSNLMKKIKSRNTKAEIELARSLWRLGIRYRKNYSGLPGKPDLVITKYKIAVFVDGEFWHGYNWEEKRDKIKNNRNYWIPKIERNIIRDRINNELLASNGWTVFRFWENEIKHDIESCIFRILCYIK